MRNMSFMITPVQIRNRTKTVTRRTGWKSLKSGDIVRAVEKCQGLKKRETIKPLAVLLVTNVRRERLDRLATDESYARQELSAEGGLWSNADEFVEMFCESHKVSDGIVRLGEPGRLGAERYRKCRPDDEVTRIEFTYLEQ